MKSPVIILSSERSGSNLLRILLDNHSSICAPVSPHLLISFSPLRHFFGDLCQRENAVRLLHEMLEFTRLPYHDWGSPEPADQVWDEFRPKSFLMVVNAVWTIKARRAEKPRFASKDIEAFHYAEGINSAIPDAKFLYLVRDPRDQVASWMRKPINFMTAYDALCKWLTDQRICHDLMFCKGIDAHLIRYEDLVRDTQVVMTGVLNSLGEDVEPFCFETDIPKGETLSWNPYWRNLSRPIMKDNTGHFSDILSAEDVEIIESQARPFMEELGYPVTSSVAWRLTDEFKMRNTRIREACMAENRSRLNEDLPLLIEKWQYEKMLKARLDSEFTAVQQ